MKKTKDSWCIAEFTPILLILLFTLYTKSAIIFANSYLGRFIAIMGIICYTKHDIAYGLFACLIVILFYQLETVAVNNVTMFTNNYEGYTNIGLGENMNQTESEHYDSYLPHTETVYKMGGTQPAKPVFEPSRIYNQHCKNNQLTYKEFPIKTEMAQHVYPEIQYNNGNICNPCDPNCEYSVMDKRMTTEEEIMNPKSSNDWLKEAWNQMSGLFAEQPIISSASMTASHGVISEQFSTYTK